MEYFLEFDRPLTPVPANIIILIFKPLNQE
jgi:hypothetical protein